MQDSNDNTNHSLRKMVFGSIFLGAVIILFLAAFVEMSLYIYPTLGAYKREMSHEGEFAVELIGKEYIENIFNDVRMVYYSTPEEIRANQYEEAYINRLIPLVDDDFMVARRTLKSCRENAEMNDVFLAFFDDECQRMVVVVDGNAAEYAFLPGQWISDENGVLDSPKTIERTMRSTWFMPVTYGQASGFTATDYTGVYDSAGELIGYMIVTVPVNAIFHQIVLFLAIYIPVMMVVILIMAYLAGKVANRRIIKPIKKLALGAREYASVSKADIDNRTSVFKNIEVKTDDEIEELWNTMVEMEDEVSTAMVQIKDATAKQERMATELDLAKQIQNAALPGADAIPGGEDRFEIYASMTAAKEVGGDFYDYFMVDDDHLAMVIADVSGKGVPAALFMMICKALIKNRTLQGGKPSEILKFINDSFCEENINEMFVTVWLGILNISTGEIIASNAGHEYPVITDDNNNYKIFREPHGVVIGIVDGLEFEDYEIKLTRGGKLFVYTDGVAEAQNSDEEMFGLDRIEESLNHYADLRPKDVVVSMKKAVDNFAGDAEQFDDITMLSLLYNG